MAHHLPAEFIVPREEGFDTYQTWAELKEHCPQGTLFYWPRIKAWGHISHVTWLRLNEAKVPKKYRALILLIG